MKQARFLILVLVTFLTSGCIDEIIDAHSRNKLVIWGEQPPEGKVGEPYVFRLGARVENTPFDDSYDFIFTFEDGALPPGTEFHRYKEDGVDYSEVIGVPTEAGSYTFAVKVHSDKLEREKDAEQEEEKDDSFSLTNTVYRDEGLYTIYIVE